MSKRRKRSALLITQFFAPEPCAAAHRMEALARALDAQGMDVTVLAPMPSFPSGTVDPAYRGKLVVRERLAGVRVLRVLHVATARKYGRYLAWMSFASLATLCAVLFMRKRDIVIVSSPPITLALPGLAVHLLRGSRLVVDVRDVFPDLPIQMGLWNERGVMARSVSALVHFLYSRASFVSAVTPNARERVMRRAGATPVLLMPNGWDRVAPASGVIKRRNGEFVATFTGNMGLANGMDLLLDAAKLVAGDEVRIALIGGGADYEHVLARIARESIENVDVYGVLRREEALGALVESDAAVSVLREGITECIPTKLFDAFAVECPVVLSGSGEARRVVSEATGGICSAPGDAESLADGLRRLACDRPLARAFGRAGKRYAADFDREAIMKRLARVVADVP